MMTDDQKDAIRNLWSYVNSALPNNLTSERLQELLIDISFEYDIGTTTHLAADHLRKFTRILEKNMIICDCRR